VSSSFRLFYAFRKLDGHPTPLQVNIIGHCPFLQWENHPIKINIKMKKMKPRNAPTASPYPARVKTTPEAMMAKIIRVVQTIPVLLICGVPNSGGSGASDRDRDSDYGPVRNKRPESAYTPYCGKADQTGPSNLAHAPLSPDRIRP